MICKSCQIADHHNCVEADKAHAWKHSAGWCDCQHGAKRIDTAEIADWDRMTVGAPSNNGETK
jgi:hypothetical protein